MEEAVTAIENLTLNKSNKVKNIIRNILGPDCKPAILAGAGISIDSPSNLLTGYAMMKGIIEHSVACKSVDFISKFISAPSFTSDNPGNFLRFELLIHRLRKYDPNLTVLNCLRDCEAPNINHYVLAKLILNRHVVITTNFDNLIETAYDNCKNNSSNKLSVLAYNDEFDNYKKGNNNQLLKIHGSFTREGVDISDSIQAEFTKVMTNNYSSKSACLSNILENNPLIVIGYSGSDDLDITPILAKSGNNRIIWIKHSNTYKDITNQVFQECKLIKSKFHALGLHKIMLEKGKDLVTVIEAPTKEMLFSLIDKEDIEFIRTAVAKHESNSLSNSYFDNWSKKLELSSTTKYNFTKMLFTDLFLKDEPVIELSEKDARYDKKDKKINEKYEESIHLIIEDFNDIDTRSFKKLTSLYRKLCGIEKSIGNMEIPDLYKIKGCIAFELGNQDDAIINFYAVLDYYESISDHERAFVILNHMNKRQLLNNNEVEKMYQLLHKIGFYPVISQQKFDEYSNILWPIHSYKAFVYETGEDLLDYNQAVTDLLEMKTYSIAMGDASGERKIDELLWKLDYYEKGIASYFEPT